MAAAQRCADRNMKLVHKLPVSCCVQAGDAGVRATA